MWTQALSGYSPSSPDDPAQLLLPRFSSEVALKPPILLGHPAFVRTWDAFSDLTDFPHVGAIIQMLVDAGYPCLCPNLEGNDWGNPVAINRAQEAFEALRTKYGMRSGPAIVLGFSMGGLLLNWVRTQASNARCIILICPVSDLNDLWANNRHGAAASINSSYDSVGPPRTDAGCIVSTLTPLVADRSILATDEGRAVTGSGAPPAAVVANVTAGVGFEFAVNGSSANGATNGSVSLTIGGYSDSLFGPRHNPAVFAPELASVPLQIWYGIYDDIVVPWTVTNLASQIGRSATLKPVASGHGDACAALVDRMSLLSFIEAHAG
jgi:Alpha/beta hydrolase family